MNRSRRNFLVTSTAYVTGFAGLRLVAGADSLGATQQVSSAGFGPLVEDPRGLLDLPQGFSYRIVSCTGEEMDDGLLVPGSPDGMATFPGPDGLTLVLRNHELHAPDRCAFDSGCKLLDRIDASKLYDAGSTSGPIAGGVTTMVFDTRKQKVFREFLSLGGTSRNCAGGPTPWGSWITCEESVESPQHCEITGYPSAREHGYAFEVPAAAEPILHKAKPLIEMGRFRREAVAVDPNSGIVFQTEDVDDGAFYRFLPNEPGKLAAGGKLQALSLEAGSVVDTRNWHEQTVEPGKSMAVSWVDLEQPESPNDDLRARAQGRGCATFARGEGIWWTDHGVYFACTSGGRAKIGQLWRYLPESAAGGRLELFIEPNDSNLIENADNLTAAPWGDLVVCEDRQGDVVRLIGVTPDGSLYSLANNRTHGEFAGVCFTPDGSTLLVNLQTIGLTIAITGPWKTRS